MKTIKFQIEDHESEGKKGRFVCCDSQDVRMRDLLQIASFCIREVGVRIGLERAGELAFKLACFAKRKVRE